MPYGDKDVSIDFLQRHVIKQYRIKTKPFLLLIIENLQKNNILTDNYLTLKKGVLIKII